MKRTRECKHPLACDASSTRAPLTRAPKTAPDASAASGEASEEASHERLFTLAPRPSPCKTTMDPNIYALVLDTLNRATSQDPEVLKPAEKKLQEWEIEPGFYSVLLDVLSNHSIDINVRWLAVMCFKNGVDRYWRKNAPHAITEEEKQKLRQGLLNSNILSEPVTQIATQQAVLISKIARFDCPMFWPNLVPELIGALKAPQPLVQHRSLLIFHHVVKALASKRLAADRRMFQELTQSVYAFILNLWHENTEQFLRHIQEGAATEVITEHLEKALLCLRILRKLTVFGFRKAHESQDAVAFLNVVFDRAKTSLECRKLLKGRGIYLLELCEKFIIHLTKVALGVLSLHPFSFVPLIRPALEFTLYFCFTEQGMALTYERFTIQCLNILKGILQCVEYKLPKEMDQVKEPLTIEAHQLKMSVLTDDAVVLVCRRLVSHYCRLCGDDLALWDAEPESFANDEAGESWKYSKRPCTEAVFMELFHGFRPLLAPCVVRMLGELPPPAPAPLDQLRDKDAVYAAVGLAAFDLYDESALIATDVIDHTYSVPSYSCCNLPACTEAVFMELFHGFRPLLAPCVVRMLGELPPPAPAPLDQLRDKDAVYAAVGLAAFDLYDEVCCAIVVMLQTISGASSSDTPIATSSIERSCSD
ncbi:unnamed protein product [Plutella xylostella]|uniref:(diamondback moth) hypothetical protein n=1 Tax=Plutella xylostella TaxID=51655 RepID=A0A8S4FNA4_PLUXY|nr:unnamed protein product [Plutella xylostella]